MSGNQGKECLVLRYVISCTDTIYIDLDRSASTDGRRKAMMTTSLRPEGPRSVRLTKRETQILGLIAQGHTSQEAGDLLFISHRTISFHLSSVYEKLGVNNRVQAFRMATRLGLIPVEPSFGACLAA